VTVLRPWWETYPAVLEAEEASLERLGHRPAVLNAELLAQSQVRQYSVLYDDPADGKFELIVTYSDFHPFFGPTVSTDHRFGNHQAPFDGRLCLLRGGTAEWDVAESAGEMIADQMPKLLRDRRDVAAAVVREPEPTGPVSETPHVEPYVGYYTYQESAVVRVDGGWPDLVEADHGALTLGIEPTDALHLRAVVLEVEDADGSLLREFDPVVRAAFRGSIRARWCRVESRPAGDGAQAALDAAVEVQPEFARPAMRRISGGEVDVIGVVFTDDIDADVVTGAVRRGDAWIFVVRPRRTAPAAAPTPRGRGAGARRTTPAAAEQAPPYLVQAMRAGRKDITARIPTLRPLSGRTVVVLGAGAIGAQSAVEFAKAGVGTLRTVEYDLLEAGNSVRWPYGFIHAGHGKAAVLHSELMQHWPYTRSEPCGMYLGMPRTSGEADPQWQLLEQVLDDVDLVYDSSAEPGVNNFASALAKERGVPYVVAAATEGGWGGYVARVRPNLGEACWWCILEHFQDEPSLLPLRDPDPATRSVWPAGCTDPTFTGTGFDVGSMAYAGVRLAVATLTEDEAGSYPPAQWNYARYSFRDASAALAGGAECHQLARHPGCRRCHS
jgi:hypothetical protein